MVAGPYLAILSAACLHTGYFDMGNSISILYSMRRCGHESVKKADRRNVSKIDTSHELDFHIP